MAAPARLAIMIVRPRVAGPQFKLCLCLAVDRRRGRPGGLGLVAEIPAAAARPPSDGPPCPVTVAGRPGHWQWPGLAGGFWSESCQSR